MFLRLFFLALTSFWASCHPVFASPVASMTEHRGVYLIHLYGDHQQMYHQYAELVKSRIQDSTLPFYGNKIIKSIELNKPSGIGGFAAKLYVEKILYPKMRHQLSDEDLALYQSFADAVGLDRDLVLKAFLFPDMGEYLLAKLYGKQLISENFPIPPMGFGCTTFVATNPRTTGKLIHARNLDYFGLGVWDKMQTVTYYHTSVPGEISYAGISSLGAPMAAPTAFNQAGIIIDLHQSTVDQVSMSGTPIVTIFENVIRKAHSLDEAISLFKSYKYTTPWKIIVSSITEAKSATIEVSADSFAVYPSTSGLLVETNHSRTPFMKAEEFSPGQMYAEDSVLRERNVYKMLNSKNIISVQDAVDIISNSVNWAQGHTEDTAVHGIPSRINNVQSVVFAPSEGVVYLGVPSRPFAKPTEGDYVPVSMNLTSPTVTAIANRHKTHQLNERQILAQADFRRANVAASEEGKLETGLGYLEAAITLDNKESAYPLMAALTAVKLAGRFWKSDSQTAMTYLQKAQFYFDQASHLGLSKYHQGIVNLFTARVLLGIGKAVEADNFLKAIPFGTSKVLDEAVANTKKKGYSIEKFTDLILSYSELDVLRF